MRTLLLYITSLLFLSSISAQWQDNLVHKMAAYAGKNQDLLFVHTDKHIYTNNEHIWFSAYLLQCGQDSTAMHQLLSVALVQAGTRHCAVQHKYAMAYGRSFGSLLLPDSIAPGEYQLLAYTNVTDKDSMPVAIFTQALAVRAIHDPAFNAVMNIAEDTTGKREIKITVRDKSTGQPVRDAAIQLYVDSQKVVNASTDKRGEYRQSLSAVLADTAGYPSFVNAGIQYHGDRAYLQKPLPAADRKRLFRMRFYPEGGRLLTQAPCRIAYEAGTDRNEPVPVKVALLKDGVPVDTLITNAQGTGETVLTPDVKAAYTFRPIQLPPGILAKEQDLHLPVIAANGIAIALKQALADDSLRFHIYAPGYEYVKLVVHNYRRLFVVTDIQTGTDGRNVLLLLNDVPKGLAVIELLDSLNRPLAERTFFAHYHKKIRLQCTFNNETQVYEKRQVVKLTLRLNKGADTLPAIASVACAQTNRFDARKQQDIASFAFLQSAIYDIPVAANGPILEDSAYLEKLLLIKGYPAYSWNEMMAGVSSPVFYSPVLQGKISAWKNQKKEPASLTLMRKPADMESIVTDRQGNFAFTYQQLLIPQDQKLWIIPNGRTDRTLVEIHDPFESINSRVAAGIRFPVADANRYAQYAQDLVLKDFSVARELTAVVVKSSRSNMIYGASNKCGDYVCPYNILNCPNHPGNPGNHLPEKGKIYHIAGGGETMYWGCTLDEPGHEAILLHDGIKTGNTFYGENFSEIPADKSEFISTLYWSPELIFNREGVAECSFYTSDIAGRFRIVINGITTNNLFYATASFEVK